MSRLRPFLEVLGALVFGLLIGAMLLAVWGYDPWVAYHALFRGAFMNMRALANTLSRATPLILTGLTFAIGARGGLFNIGAQGQMTIGAVVAVAGGLLPLAGSGYFHVAVGVALAALAGVLWSLPAAVLKLTRGVHEVISTIMLNWIAFWLASYLVVQKLTDPFRGERTFQVPLQARFPILVMGSELTWAVVLSVGLAFLVYWVLWHQTAGYEVRAVGLNPEAARAAGISPRRAILYAFLLGGLTAGLAGGVQVFGRFPYALTNTLDNLGTIGFDGIAVALIGRTHPLGVIPSALFLGALSTGAALMGFRARVPVDVIYIIQGTIILAMAVPEAWRLLRRPRGTMRLARRA